MRYLVTAVAVLIPQAVLAQVPPERTVQVTGTGTIQTAPDIALLTIYIRGEGPTPDAATTMIAAKQKAVNEALVGLLGSNSELTASNVTIIEARSGACADGQGYGSRPRLSTGDCAVSGFIATMQTSVRTRAVEKAATAAGLASRLGASDARVQGFALSDPEAARARANMAAIADAAKRAAALASGAGLRLGPIIAVRDQASYDITVTGALRGANAPAAPPAPRVSPVTIDLKPTPIETRAQVFVSYAIAS
ncbi:SIMPL domain-containing protein [Sphingomonas sp. ZB1N12]